MECQVSEIVNYSGFPQSNLIMEQCGDLLDVSLVDNLKNIERCIKDKDLSHGLNIVRQLLKNSAKSIQSGNVDELKFGSLQIEKKIGKVILNKQVIELSSNEFSLLLMLADKPNEIISRDELHESILKTEYDGLNRSIDNTVSRIRKKLGDDNLSQLKIKSIRGKGYLFSADLW